MLREIYLDINEILAIHYQKKMSALVSKLFSGGQL